MQFQITKIEFDCSLDNELWTPKNKLETEEKLSYFYTGKILEADNEEDLIEKITCSTGWCIKSIDCRHILNQEMA